MIKKITLSLSKNFIFTKRNDDVMPIKAVSAYVNDTFKEDVKVIATSFTLISMTCAPKMVETVKDGLLEFMQSNYSIAMGETLSIEIVDYVPDEAESTSNTDSKISPNVTELLSKVGDSASPVTDMYDGIDTPPSVGKVDEKEKSEKSPSKPIISETPHQKTDAELAEEKRAKSEADIKKCLDEADKFIGGEEYVKLVTEISKVAPLIVKNNTLDTFTHQTYLFSINDGYGLEDYLKNLYSLLCATGITQESKKPEVYVKKLDAPKGDGEEALKNALNSFSFNMSDKLEVACFDISEWMNHLNGKPFKNFLIELEKGLDKHVVVFRVPFVDKEVLSAIKDSLNDVVFVKSVSFPPYTSEEIRECAEQIITSSGFSIESNAWEYFDKRIMEEKSDGKFYGKDTVRKVVRELLYNAQLIDATVGGSENVVTRDKAIRICADTSDMGLSGYEMLDDMVGGTRIKEKIEEIISQIELSRRSPELGAPCLHMRFVGNPGTGKTTVARIIGKILKERGVLRIGNFYECAGRDLCGRYIGETAPKTASMCRDAYGSVLFIDEAYSLYRGDEGSRDFGREALDTLIAEMENHRKDFVVIMAGYPDDMDTLMRGNAGLQSRMPYLLEFPNFTKEELYTVYVNLLKKSFDYDENLLDAVKEYFDALSDDVIKAKEFSNGRYVRNLFERTWAKAALRSELNKCAVKLTREDFIRASADTEFKQVIPKKRKFGFVD